MFLVVVNHAVVHLIRKAQGVELDTELGNSLQFFSGEYLSNRVVRSVDDDSLGLGWEGFAELVKVDGPFIAWFDAWAGRRVKWYKNGLPPLKWIEAKYWSKNGSKQMTSSPGCKWAQRAA
jgi:hypothetical protein